MEKESIINHAWTFGFGGMEKSELGFMYDNCHGKKILELGSEMGQSAYVIAMVANDLTCVDVWDDTYEHLNHDERQKNCYVNDQILYKDKEINKNNIFEQFKENCKEFISTNKIKYVKGKTQDVVNEFDNESFDIILIDADHSHEGVISDINNYIPKLKKDGYLFFHDYGCGTWTGVTTACNQAVSEGKIRFEGRFERIAIFKVNEK